MRWSMHSIIEQAGRFSNKGGSVLQAAPYVVLTVSVKVVC